MSSTTFRVDDTDARIEYVPSGSWTNGTAESWNKDGTYKVSFSHDSYFSLFFRGTGVSVYGHGGPRGGQLDLQLDRRNPLNWDDYQKVFLSSTDYAGGATPYITIDGLEDEDHELVGWQGAGFGLKWLDYIEVRNTAGTGIDPQSSGPKAADVPPEAVVVDSSDPRVIGGKQQLRNHPSLATTFNASDVITTTEGEEIEFSFTGVGIWIYSTFRSDAGYSALTITSEGQGRSEPVYVSPNTGRDGPLRSQRLLWYNASLPMGSHTLRLKKMEKDNEFNVDFFRVLESPLPDMTSISSTPFVPTNRRQFGQPLYPAKPNIAAIVGGAVGGLVFLLALIGIFFFYRRMNMKKARSHAQPSPKLEKSEFPGNQDVVRTPLLTTHPGRA